MTMTELERSVNGRLRIKEAKNEHMKNEGSR